MKRLFFGFLLFIVLTYLGLTRGVVPLLTQNLERIFHQEVIQGHRDYLQGYFQVMIGHLLETTPSHWPDQIAQWRPHFGYKIALLSMASAEFTPQEREVLNLGVIFLQGDSDISNFKILSYKKIEMVIAFDHPPVCWEGVINCEKM